MAALRMSLILPTYNRPAALRHALESLARQTLDAADYEVIVVDDGSETPPDFPAEGGYPFTLQYIRQPNAGATEARKNGVRHSDAEILVFMDDDVRATEGALEALAAALEEADRVIVIGRLVTHVPESRTAFARWQADLAEKEAGQGPFPDRELPLAVCNTQLLAVRRTDYDALGGLQDPTRGWPNWDDVDFGYRAHLAGYTLVEAGGALAYHWDQSLTDLESTTRRWFRAAYSAARLFQTHPALEEHLPMFADKALPRKGDSLSLILRKQLRPVASSRSVLWLLETAAGTLAAAEIWERFYPVRGMLRHLYRWIIGAYIFRGFRAGLKDLHLRT